MTKAAAILAWFTGLGFGVPGVIGLVHFSRHGEVWTFLGFPTYGGGPFERWGIPTSVGLLAGFTVVCLAEVAVGVLLWSGWPVGLWLALALIPVEMAYWIGFALPVGPILGLVRGALVIALLIGS